MPVQTNPLTYNGFVEQLANMAVVQTQTVLGVVQGVDSWFTLLIPQVLNYAEQRIQRDIDLLALLVSSTYTLNISTNMLTIPVEDFETIQTIQIDPDDGLPPILATSKEFIQNVWNSPTSPGRPFYFAMYGGDAVTFGNTSMLILFGPYADQNYQLLVTGTRNAKSLAQFAIDPDASTQTTFISTWLPDLLLQASMIIISQYQRNFDATSNDPSMAASYESNYQNLLKSAIVEEARRKWQAPAWSSQSPPVIATPTRG